ncbi:TonB family protein [Phenylobacterium sp.]|uniref:TonB family protein n=1 Tax=Phenylobacterium sp. TaxID=1871053 RepID=UPI0011F7943E|nr:TonB family protein [Phenylobacterium sp.]THD61390.1 MAG: TonB family protein [Phenylobacterium sp.]
MLAAVLALLAATSDPAAPATTPPPRTVSGVAVPQPQKTPPVAATVDMIGDEDAARSDFVAVWPATAYHTGVDGHVTLSCMVDVHGLAERCTVAAESPAGKGLGRAALELRPTFKLVPAKGPDGAPVNATETISVAFKAPDLQFDEEAFFREYAQAAKSSPPGMGPIGTSSTMVRGDPLIMREVTMLDAPVWIAAATFDDLATAYPAKGGGVEGYAVDHCHVRRNGGLDTCQIIKESPDGHDFGKAALGLAAKFRLDPAVVARAPSATPAWVDIPIRLPPAALADRTVMAPLWTVGFDPRMAPKLFPPEAVANGLSTGRGVARCTVAADGAMSACAPEAGDPDGLGFSEAAVRLAATLKMNLWSADGAPVVGGVVHIPIRLNLRGVAEASNAPAL